MDSLNRWGLKWNGPKEFVSTLMPDGLWTEWHIADQKIKELRAKLDVVVSHATGGRLDNTQVPVDLINIFITEESNYSFESGKNKGREEAKKEIAALRSKLEAILAHSTGGELRDVDLPLNETCVFISAQINNIYEKGFQAGKKGGKKRRLIIKSKGR